MWRAVAILVIVSAALFAALTVWTNHTTAATHATSHRFAQNAKSICDHAPHTKAGLRQAADELAGLAEPPNVHRAVVRLELHWHRLLDLEPGTKPYRAEMKQARLSADLLGIEACRRIEPR
jgi:hypothetical protein